MLHALIADNHKTRKIQWTTEALKAYEDVKLQVSKCTIVVGAGAWIPYKRGDDDVGWFISYSHS